MVRAFFMAISNTCVRLSIIASPRSFDDGRQRANPGDGSDKDGGWFAAAGHRYTTRRRRLSSITRAPCRKVMGVPGQRSQAAR